MATAVFFLLEAGWSTALSLHGTEEAKREVLPSVCAGKAFLGIASTEPTRGKRSLPGMHTTVRHDGSVFVLHGEKSFISGTEEAKRLGGGHLTLAKDPAGGFTFLYVPTNTEGVLDPAVPQHGPDGHLHRWAHLPGRSGSREVLHRYPREGLRPCDGGVLDRADVRGRRVHRRGRTGPRAGIAYIRERTAFGQPLGKFEAIQFELADLWSQLEAVKWQVRRAAWLNDRYTLKGDSSHRSEVDRVVSLVKLQAPQIAFECVKRVMMWHGASGYTKDVGLEIGLRGMMSYVRRG